MKLKTTRVLPKSFPNHIKSLLKVYLKQAPEPGLRGELVSGQSIYASIENLMKANMSVILTMLVEAREIRYLTNLLGDNQWKFFSEQLELSTAYVRDCLQVSDLFTRFGLNVSDCGSCIWGESGSRQIHLLDISDTTLRELASRNTPDVVQTYFMERLLSGQRVLRKDVRAMVEEYHRYRDPGPMPGTA